MAAQVREMVVWSIMAYDMTEFYAAQEAEDVAAEAATLGYRTELVEYWKINKRMTFKAWLVEQGEKS